MCIKSTRWQESGASLEGSTNNVTGIFFIKNKQLTLNLFDMSDLMKNKAFITQVKYDDKSCSSPSKAYPDTYRVLNKMYLDTYRIETLHSVRNPAANWFM